MKVKDARSYSAEAQEVLRCKVVEAIRGGMTQVAATQVFRVSRAAVCKWMRQWREGGKKALVSRKRGRPPGKRLQGWQAATIVNLITTRTPEQLRFPFMLWTRQAVAELMEDRFGIRLSVWTMGRYLKSWGMTPQKPLRRAFEQNPQAVERWLKREYPSIRRQARQEGAQIYWGDEMGLRSDHQAGRSYSMKGRTPVIAGTGQRFGCSMISALTNRGKLRFMVFRERFTVKVFVNFLQRLSKDARRKVYLIVDRHPVHKARAVERWLAENPKQLRLFFLPAYSPELNPDEMLNNDVKANAVGRRRPRNCAELMSNVRGYLRSTQKQPHLVCTYFQAETVRYATN
jgi:transposase